MNPRKLINKKQKKNQYPTINYALKGGFAMNRKILYRTENGEYMPCNENDKLLLKACIQYNAKLENGDILDDGECPIKTNLLYYYPKDNKLRLFRQWCDIQNEMLKEARKNKNIQEK